MAHRFQYFLLTTLALAGPAQACGEFPLGVPMSPAGVSGPLGLAAAIAAYIAYRLYRRHSGKNS